jgi:hypothetical protein
MPQEVAERSGSSFNAILRAIRGGELHAVELVCDVDQLAGSYSRRLGRGSPPGWAATARSARPSDVSDLRGSGRQRTRRSP